MTGAPAAIIPAAASRSALFSFAGRGFLTTDPDELRECWSLIDAKAEADPIPQALTAPAAIDLEREHVRLFLAPRTAPCPPWQSVHEDDAQLMGSSHHSALAWFRSHGVEPAKDAEPADHIGMLLTFYGHLLSVESEDHARFAARHLSWIPGFCDSMEHHAELDFFRLLAVYTRTLLRDSGCRSIRSDAPEAAPTS